MFNIGDTVHIIPGINGEWGFNDSGYFATIKPKQDPYTRVVKNITCCDRGVFPNSQVEFEGGGSISANFIEEFYDNKGLLPAMVQFTNSKSSIKYRLSINYGSSFNYFFLTNDYGSNQQIFTELGVVDKRDYITKILGKEPRDGWFPEIPFTDIEDFARKFNKLIYHLQVEYAKLDSTSEKDKAIAYAFEVRKPQKTAAKYPLEEALADLGSSQDYDYYHLNPTSSITKKTFKEYKYKKHEKSKFHRTW